MKKILIIGKRGFIGNNLSTYLKKFYNVSHKSFKDLNKKRLEVNNFDYVINTSINKNYIAKRYNQKFDNDYKISNLINNHKTTYIFLSTRKVYKSTVNIKENSKLLPKSNYAKNKLITEQKLKKKLKKNLLILRLSNVIGDKNKIKKIHNTFIDIFFDNIKKGVVLDNKKDFKDFISIDKFCEIMKNIISKNLRGVFNVSIGKKIYLNDLIGWLNKFNNKKFMIIRKNIKNDCFFLNNKKLMSKIKIKNSTLELKKYCFRISKKKFS
ncbi:NAD-dependent epimerase/dehydratase family protein [Pelagibacterales bacterium SAG-MED07]|nr:NAD-dependent epimerase/dehydratase family protein [Pelagibacterales bacterium SAG-MED07]